MRNRLSIKRKISIIILSVIGIICILQTVYFLYLSGVIEEQKQKNVDNTVSQIGQNLNNYVELLHQISMALSYNKFVQDYLVRETDAGRIELRNNIENLFTSIRSFNVDVIYMFLVDQKKNIHNFSEDISIEAYNKILASYRDYAENADASTVYNFFVLNDNSQEVIYFYCFLPINKINLQESDRENIGTSIICCKVASERIIKNIDMKQDVDFILMNEEKQGINLLKMQQYESVVDIENTDLSSQGYVTKQLNVKEANWTIIGRIFTGRIAKELNSTRWLLILEFFIIVIFMVVLHVTFSRIITTPIQKIISFIHGFSVKSRRQRLDLEASGEISVIAKHINDMLDKVEDMTQRMLKTQEKLYETELNEKEAVLYALQSQVNPHFLYNTLECVRSIAIVHDINEIVEISTSISDIFRYNIKGKGFVLVENEIEITKKYLNIMNIRFMGKFDVDMNIDPCVMRCRMIKMVLQPIVENSFNHGFISNKSKGTLWIDGVIENETIVFRIKDNGVGMEKEKYEEVIMRMQQDEGGWNNPDSIGLVNINRRIKSYFGKKYGLEIQSQRGEYTLVTVTIPLNFLS